jgi:hypothetical protein
VVEEDAEMEEDGAMEEQELSPPPDVEMGNEPSQDERKAEPE